MESAQPWMKNDNDVTVQTMLSKAEMAKALKDKKTHYSVIADLFIKGSCEDITGNRDVFAWVNRPRNLEDQEKLSLEEYMKLFPEQCKDAMDAAKARRDADARDYNPKSMAKWRNPGFMPLCVANLLLEAYPESKERADAFRRFFNYFPKFRVSSSRI